MNYSDLFHVFYRKRRAGGLKGLVSKSKIVEFFFYNAMDDDGKEMLPTSGSSLDKWFDGDPRRRPSASMWENIVKNSGSSKLQIETLNLLTDDNSLIREIAIGVEIHLKQGEHLDRRKFAHAVTRQFVEIAKGYGESENVIPAEYAKKPPAIGFDVYLDGAIDKYKWMHILGEDECLLEDYFVCNRVSVTATVFSNRSRMAPIEDATLKKLCTFDVRGETCHIILIGYGGIGKTLMLRHLFLESAYNHKEYGLLPVLIELRNFSYLNGDIVACIVKCINEFDPSFDGVKAEDILLRGQCQILMDGLDELDPSDVKEFQRKLSEFVSRYPNNQIVITSRDCDAAKSIGRFVHLYIAPLDSNQSMKLIDNLLADDVDAVSSKSKIINYMNNGFIMKDGVFASNPMLLTYIVRHHHKIDTFSKDKANFYGCVYRAIVEEHDAEKEAFDRVFKSVDNADDFTDVFEEFCGKSYIRGLFEFDRSNFKNVFRCLKARDKLSNPPKCTMKAFQQDACATACMMFEQDYDIYYIDPGFQEYLFAEYYFGADTETVVDMGLTLRNTPIGTFRNTDAFDMLYKKASIKVEVGMYLPYLDKIFKDQTEEEAFQRYLCFGYGSFSYTVFYSDIISTLSKCEFEVMLPESNENEPMNMLHYLILRTIHAPTSIQLNTADTDMCNIGQETAFLVGIYNSEDMRKLHLERFPQVLYSKKDNPKYINYPAHPLLDNTGSVLCLGNDYMVDFREQSPHNLRHITEVIKSDAEEIYRVFLKVQAYYKQISNRQANNQFT